MEEKGLPDGHKQLKDLAKMLVNILAAKVHFNGVNAGTNTYHIPIMHEQYLPRATS